MASAASLLLAGFDSQRRTRLIFGPDTVDRLGELTRELGITRVLVVTDPGIAATGHLRRAQEALHNAGVQTVVFDQVRENPTTLDVDRCLEAARDAAIDGIIGFGGGSSMDTAKGCNFLLTNGGRMQDYWGVGKAAKPMLPLIAVPTTAGTGSECQSFALIADEESHQKMACGDPKAAPVIALLDPTLTVSQPRAVTACTGIDAIAHAVESAVTRKRSAFSLLMACEAFKLTSGYLERVLENPDDLEARAAMQLGAAYAGIAIENSMLGAAHSAANPLTAHFNVVHGKAVGVMLPHVVRFNAHEAAAAETYRDMVVYAGLADTGTPVEVAVERLALRLGELLKAAGLASLLDDGVSAEAVERMAREAAGQWTARYNPREIAAPDFEALYAAALSG